MEGGNSLRLCLICFFITAGLGVDFNVGIVSHVHDLLTELKSPLRPTILTCWNSEKTVQLVSRITNGLESFPIKIIRDTNEFAPDITERHHEVLIADLGCRNTTNIIEKVNRTTFNFIKVIIFDSSVGMHHNSVPNIDIRIQILFKNSPILPMSQVFYVSEDFSQNKFVVKKVYRIGLNEPLIVEEFPFSGEERTELTRVSRKTNFRGYPLRAAMVITNNDSLNHLDDYRDIHIDAMSKVCFKLTNQLIQFVNATVKYSIVADLGYENQTAGKWNGLIGELLSNEADLGATPLVLTEERLYILEYVSTSTSDTAKFLFRAPRLSYTDNIYVLPFQPYLWICAAVLVLLITMFLSVAVMIELKLFSSSEIQYSVNDVYMIICGALCQQGSHVTPNSAAGRIIMAIAFMILMFLYASYSANILALLQSPSNRIKTLHDLHESKIEVYAEDTDFNRHYFPLSTDTLRKNFYEKKLCNNDGEFRLATFEDGIQKIRQGENAFFTELGSAYKAISRTFMESEKCGLQEINFFPFNMEPWYVIQKNSSYKEVLKIGMMRIREHGLQKRESLRYYPTKPKCLGGGSNFVSASFNDTFPVILTFLWGMALTLLAFICELFSARFSFIRQKISAILILFQIKGN